jgi:hypothetical protein
MDPGMAFRFGTAAVDAATGNDGHVRTFADDKTVIDHVVQAGLA